MKIEQILELTGSRVVCGSSETDIRTAFSSDLMSDVLAHETEGTLLITGLANIQTIRTADMAGVTHILFVRGKKVLPQMCELAVAHGMVLMESDFSMFKTSGLLFDAGLEPLF